MSTVGE